MENMKNLSSLISLKEASELSELSPDHLRRLAEQGKLKAQKIGGVWITTKDSLDQYLRNRKPPGRPNN